MALRREIVEFIGFHQSHDAHQTHGIGKIAVVQMKMRMAFQMIDAFAFFRGRTTHDAVNVVTLFQQKFGKIGAVLAGNTGDERGFHE